MVLSSSVPLLQCLLLELGRCYQSNLVALDVNLDRSEVVECFVVALDAVVIDEALPLDVEITGGSRHGLQRRCF